MLFTLHVSSCSWEKMWLLGCRACEKIALRWTGSRLAWDTGSSTHLLRGDAKSFRVSLEKAQLCSTVSRPDACQNAVQTPLGGWRIASKAESGSKWTTAAEHQRCSAALVHNTIRSFVIAKDAQSLSHCCWLSCILSFETLHAC